MLKPVKPRGDTSVAFLATGLYISEPANICHGIHRQVGTYEYELHDTRFGGSGKILKNSVNIL